MIKFLGILIGLVTLDLYFFPIEFTFLPAGINSKMILAGVGILCFIYNTIRNREMAFNSDDIQLIGLVMLISLLGLASMTYNGTFDDAYATYFISAGTWIMGAYATINYLNFVHKKTTWQILLHYLVVICVFQCIIAKWIEMSPALSDFIDAYFKFGQQSYRDLERLYGIGAALDVAGIRFSAVLVLMFYFLSDDKHPKSNWTYFIYMLSIIIITGLGNIIGRTTTVGAGLGLIYFLWISLQQGTTLRGNFLKTWLWFFFTLLITIPIFVFFYQTDEGFHENMRFAFEGFFSLVEKGTWEVDSNEILKDMYVYPETLKTWIIGDGYFSSARNDPHYLGEITAGYYMGTDVGYLRFIFYFGILGLAAFVSFMIKSAVVCSKKIPHSGMIMLLLLATNFIVWFKVSTDIFLVFALLLCLPSQKEEETSVELLAEEKS